LGRLSKTAHFGRKQNCSLRQKRRLAFWTSRIEASERSAAKLGLIKHQLGSVKGSWTVPRGLKREARPPDLIGAAAARGMSKPTPIVLFLVGIGLGLFGLCILGIESLQHKWVLAISICLVAYGAFLYVIAKRPNSN
jgi:hypothetical protein